jgi:hypothetical protein
VLRLPESPRARRRLAWRAGVAIVVAALAILLAFFRNTGHSLQTPTTDKPAVVYHEPKHVVPTADGRRAAERTIEGFVQTAIIREHPGLAWELATPHMRQGSTRAEWEAGTLPVPPYPRADYRSYGVTLKYSYRGVLGYDVLVLPKTDSGEQRVYACELDEIQGRWLVDFCYPRTTL